MNVGTLIKGWSRNGMAARGTNGLRDGYHVKRSIVGALYDRKVEFGPTRAREAA